MIRSEGEELRMFEVKKALPVWGATMKNKWNQFAGFYTKLEKPLVCGWKHAGFGAGENRGALLPRG